MGSRIDTILMCVKFGDDQISSLDFSFIGGGVPLMVWSVEGRCINTGHPVP